MRREVTGEKMSVRSYVQVPVSEGENVRRILAEWGLLDREHKPVVEGGSLLLPLVDGSLPTVKKLLQGTAGVVTGHRRFESTDRRSKTLAEALKEILTPSELELLPRAYDLIGNIAVLEIPDEIEHHAEVIGEAFLSIHPNFTTVLAKKGAISGTKRTRKYRFLAGDKTTRTIHREYGCRFVVDLEQAYFSPRLLEEHNRVAGLTQDGECVIDMFCGVGPFSIHIAKSRRAKVIAVDINPAAISLLKESLKLNRLLGEVVPVVADIREYLSSYDGDAVDRVIMNHPSGASSFVGDACRVLRPSGTMHYYDFVGGPRPEATLQSKIMELVHQAGHRVLEITAVRRVRDSAPREYQMVADVVIH